MIPLLAARISPGALDFVAEVLASGYVGHGTVVADFKDELAAWLMCDADRLVLTNSCTSALYLAVLLAGAHRIVTTPMTFIATAAAICHAGAVPVWVDCEPHSCQMSVQLAVDSRRPRPVLAVAWAGWSPRLDALRETTFRYSAPVILDAAQALGAQYEGRPIHAWADFTAYSFSSTKHLTTGDGGALICPDAETAARAERMAWFGMRRWRKEGERVAVDQDVTEIGFKFHMNNLDAAVGLAGLTDLDAALARCRANAEFYRSRLPLGAPQNETPSPWVQTLFVDDPRAFMDHAASCGVEAGQPHRRVDANSFDGSRGIQLPNVDWAQAHYVCVPVGWWVTDDDRQAILDAIQSYPGAWLWPNEGA